MEKPKCSKCGKIITGIVKISCHKKKTGKKNINNVRYYDEECFKRVNMEKALYEHKRKKAANKNKCCK